VVVDLGAGHPAVDDALQRALPAIVEAGDVEVHRPVDQGRALRLLPDRVERLLEALVGVLDRES